MVVGPLNYEGKEKHYVEIRVSDKEGLFRAQRFDIDIIDINDVPHVSQMCGEQSEWCHVCVFAGR